LRDLTRGGLASALVEIAEASNLHFRICERDIPVAVEIQAACELLGFDPLHVANEGRFVAFVPEQETKKTIEVLQTLPTTAGATVIGTVSDDDDGLVTLITSLGAERLLEMMSGDQLPRIC
jgi:hydrogenase expression/formation protein HypE